MNILTPIGALCLAAAAAPALAAPLAPSAAAVPVQPVSLRLLEPGLWQLDVKGRPSRSMCVADAMALIQVEHDQGGCRRLVVADEPRSSTVHYSCQGAGWGRTTVRVDTPHGAVITTQGIARNQPFDYTVQARRIGPCGAQAALKPR